MTDTPQSFARGQALSRTCPICSASFTPLTVRASTCDPKCGKRAEYLRARGRAFERGECDLTPATIEAVIAVRAMDDLIADEIAAREIAEEEALAAAEAEARRIADEKWRAMTAELFRQVREYHKRIGWKPIVVTAKPPEERQRFTVKVPPHLLRPKGKDKPDATVRCT